MVAVGVVSRRALRRNEAHTHVRDEAILSQIKIDSSFRKFCGRIVPAATTGRRGKRVVEKD